jgi:hypothetical protein
LATTTSRRIKIERKKESNLKKKKTKVKVIVYVFVFDLQVMVCDIASIDSKRKKRFTQSTRFCFIENGA